MSKMNSEYNEILKRRTPREIAAIEDLHRDVMWKAKTKEELRSVYKDKAAYLAKDLEKFNKLKKGLDIHSELLSNMNTEISVEKLNFLVSKETTTKLLGFKIKSNRFSSEITFSELSLHQYMDLNRLIEKWFYEDVEELNKYAEFKE